MNNNNQNFGKINNCPNFQTCKNKLDVCSHDLRKIFKEPPQTIDTNFNQEKILDYHSIPDQFNLNELYFQMNVQIEDSDLFLPEDEISINLQPNQERDSNPTNIIDNNYETPIAVDIINEICINPISQTPKKTNTQKASVKKRKTQSKNITFDSKNKKKCLNDSVCFKYHLVIIDPEHPNKDKILQFDRSSLDKYSRRQMFFIIEQIKKNYKGTRNVVNVIDTAKRNSIPYIDMDRTEAETLFSCIIDYFNSKNQHHSLMSLLLLSERKLAERLVLDKDEALDSFYNKISTQSFHSYDLNNCKIGFQRDKRN